MWPHDSDNIAYQHRVFYDKILFLSMFHIESTVMLYL